MYFELLSLSNGLIAQYEIVSNKRDSTIKSKVDVSIILEDGTFSMEIFGELVSSLRDRNLNILNKGIAEVTIIKRPTLGSSVIKNGQLIYTPKKEGIDTVVLRVKTHTGATVIYSVTIDIDSAGEASYKVINFSHMAMISKPVSSRMG